MGSKSFKIFKIKKLKFCEPFSRKNVPSCFVAERNVLETSSFFLRSRGDADYLVLRSKSDISKIFEKLYIFLSINYYFFNNFLLTNQTSYFKSENRFGLRI